MVDDIEQIRKIGNREKPTLHDCSMDVLKSLLNSNKFKRILEIGPGFGSTDVFRNYAKEYNSYVLSIETDENWHRVLSEMYPKNEYGEIVLSDTSILKCKPIIFEYNFQGMFDLVFIDGPNGHSVLKKYYKRSINDLLRPYGMKYHRRATLQSSWVLDNVWNNIPVGGHIVVDKRYHSVLYHLRKYGNKIKYYPRGTPASYKKMCKAIAEKSRLSEYITSCSLLIKIKE